MSEGMEFGEYIYSRRISLQLTLREATKKTGIPVTRLCQLEKQFSEEVPTEAEIEALKQAYDLKSIDAEYVPDYAGMQKHEELFAALESGMSDEEILNRFGVFVCRSNGRYVVE